VVGVYGCGSIFVESLTCGDNKMVGAVTYGTKVVAKMSRVDSALLVAFQENVNDSDAMGLAMDVFEKLKLSTKAKVLVWSGLTLSNVFEKGEEEEEVPQMRQLCNSFWKENSIRKLDTPSYISGIGAAFLSLCEMYKVPCAAFVVPQTTHLRVDIECVSAFEPALSLALDDEKRVKSILKQLKSKKLYRNTIRSSKLETQRRSTAHLYM